ncbi:MAG: zinc-ribbon domain-containing protein [Synergistaceae bacterium]
MSKQEISWSDFLGIPIQGEVTEENCLATLNPELAKEWHPTKNGNLTPYDVTCGSDIKVWWGCSKGHEWESKICNRNKGNNCPYCSGQRVCKDNCLATLNPELAKEWHPTKNGDLTPYDVVCGSDKKIWWKCKKGHEWISPINKRDRGDGCPYCSGKRVCKDNCLATLNPKLAKEWDYEANRNLTQNDVTCYSSKKVWWVCEKGHKWIATVSNRNLGRGCPYCVGKKTCKANSLATLNPELAKEWHPTKNRDLTPKDVTCGSNKKIWWECNKGHSWQVSVANRNKGSGCPYCSGHKVCKDNCLEALNPELAKEWHPTKNGDLTPYDVTCGSHKKAWWICKEGHQWQSVISSRNDGNGCPYCAGKKIYKKCLFVNAKEIISQENIKSRKEYEKWWQKKGRVKGLPSAPQITYKDEWQGWFSFLGKEE